MASLDVSSRNRGRITRKLIGVTARDDLRSWLDDLRDRIRSSARNGREPHLAAVLRRRAYDVGTYARLTEAPLLRVRSIHDERVERFVRQVRAGFLVSVSCPQRP